MSHLCLCSPLSSETSSESESEEFGAQEESLEVSGIALVISLVKYYICNKISRKYFFVSR